MKYCQTLIYDEYMKAVIERIVGNINLKGIIGDDMGIK